jgi:hypothetical protein
MRQKEVILEFTEGCLVASRVWEEIFDAKTIDM